MYMFKMRSFNCVGARGAPIAPHSHTNPTSHVEHMALGTTVLYCCGWLFVAQCLVVTTLAAAVVHRFGVARVRETWTTAFKLVSLFTASRTVTASRSSGQLPPVVVPLGGGATFPKTISSKEPEAADKGGRPEAQAPKRRRVPVQPP